MDYSTLLIVHIFIPDHNDNLSEESVQGTKQMWSIKTGGLLMKVC